MLDWEWCSVNRHRITLRFFRDNPTGKRVQVGNQYTAGDRLDQVIVCSCVQSPGNHPGVIEG